MPAIRLTNRYSDRGTEITIQVDFIGIPLPKARIVNAWIAGTLSAYQGRELRVDDALDGIVEALGEKEYAVGVLSRAPTEIELWVTKG